MPDTIPDARSAAVREALARLQRGHRIRAVLDATILGCAAAGVVYVLALATSNATRGLAATATIVGMSVFAYDAVYWWSTWTLARTALDAERRWPALDNLVITASEALAGHRIHPLLAGELYAQAAARLEAIETAPWARSRIRGTLAIAAIGVTIILIAFAGPPVPAPRTDVAASTRSESIREARTLRVTLTPPAYSGRPESSVVNPVQIQVLEGTTLRIELAEHDPIQFAASSSRAVVIGDRLIHIQVQPDERPVVTIERPGQDLVFGSAAGEVPVAVIARDDLQLASLALRYTRISGGGETFSFEEGDIPLSEVSSSDGTSRRASGAIVLDRLDLQDGDTLVYRAVARDHKPGADPALSESFLIEIGKRGDAVAGGFALPEDRDRQALSQQMLILKTERLQSERSKLTAEAILERSQLLAVEQRMVRAEFLFMTGGEVVDEVEEAEHSDELAQGRFENQGQLELLNAIREMSRAEARLNAADTSQALVFERRALQALQRAFDRRRYFLRTLPERARIDLSRRLSGDLSSAHSSTRAPTARGDDPAVNAIRQVMLDLSEAVRTGSRVDADLAARLIALDPQSTTLQQVGIRLTTAGGDETRAAAQSAQMELQALLRRRLGKTAGARLPRDPLLGQLADQLSATGSKR